MKKVLIAMAITLFAYTGAEAQTKCDVPAAKHKTAVKHKTVAKTTRRTATNTITACRMVPYQVCTIRPDRRSVSCYKTTDGVDQTPVGEPVIYGPTGPMPGEVVKFKVRTVVVKGEDKGAFCKRNAANNATVCYQPGIIIRDQDGYYSYGEPVATRGKSLAGRVTAK